METLKIVFSAAGYLLVLISLIPLIRNDNWFFRVFEYPRSQKLILNTFFLIVYVSVYGIDSTPDIVFTILLFLNFIYLCYQVWPYTLLSKHQIKKSAVTDKEKHIRLLIFNVFQDNRDVDACVKTINRNNPDVVLLVETDEWWKKELDRNILAKYQYHIGKPLSNTYGMLLYSKFELVNPRIEFLIEPDIPSIHTELKLPSGDKIKLYGLHPKPPVPHENPRSTERDAEILLVGKQAKSSSLPVVVAGDLNDVAWSYTTELFMKVSGLLDPRRGRGFFNTFHAKYWFLRWPLDHVFCSTHFQLISLRRLKCSGSDHFPMFIELALCEEKASKNKKEMLSADSQEKKVASKKIRSAMN